MKPFVPQLFNVFPFSTKLAKYVNQWNEICKICHSQNKLPFHITFCICAWNHLSTVVKPRRVQGPTRLSLPTPVNLFVMISVVVELSYDLTCLPARLNQGGSGFMAFKLKHYYCMCEILPMFYSQLILFLKQVLRCRWSLSVHDNFDSFTV